MVCTQQTTRKRQHDRVPTRDLNDQSLFVRNGILSIADYDSTLMGVIVVVVVVVVVVVFFVVTIFTMG